MAMDSGGFVLWSARINVSNGITIEQPGINLKRSFRFNEKVIAQLPGYIALSNIEPEYPVNVRSSLYDEGIYWPVERRYIDVESPLPDNPPRDVLEVEDIELAEIPSSIQNMAGATRGCKLVFGALWLLNHNASALESVDFSTAMLDYLQENIDTIGTMLLNAISARQTLEQLDGDIFCLDQIPRVDILEPHQIPDMAVILESFSVASIKNIRVTVADQFKRWLRVDEEKGHSEESPPDEDVAKSIYVVFGFPPNTNQQLLQIAAEVFSLLLGTFGHTNELSPIETLVNDMEDHFGYIRVSVLLQLRSHLFSQMGGSSLRVARVTKGLNHDSHASWPTFRSTDYESPFWFMQDHGTFRRYWRASVAYHRPINTELTTSTPRVIDTSIYIPMALSPGPVKRVIHVVVDINKDKQQPRDIPFARVPSIGNISNLREANAVSIQCISEHAAGRKASFVQVDLNQCRHELLYVDGVCVPPAYVWMMRLMNELEDRQYDKGIPKAIRPQILVKIIELKYSEPENILRLIIKTRPVDEQEASTPVILSKEEICASLSERFPSIIIGDKPRDLKSQVLDSPRESCDMCYLCQFYWHFPDLAFHHREPIQCSPENGYCSRWSHAGVPTTFTEETDAHAKEIYGTVGYKPEISNVFEVGDPLPYRALMGASTLVSETDDDDSDGHMFEDHSDSGYSS